MQCKHIEAVRCIIFITRATKWWHYCRFVQSGWPTEKLAKRYKDWHSLQFFSLCSLTTMFHLTIHLIIYMINYLMIYLMIHLKIYFFDYLIIHLMDQLIRLSDVLYNDRSDKPFIHLEIYLMIYLMIHRINHLMIYRMMFHLLSHSMIHLMGDLMKYLMISRMIWWFI